MKELSIEEKAERYDEVIEGIQEILSTGEDSIKMSRLQLRLQGILPELKENADEKIRKNLIAFLKEEYGTNSNARFAGIKVKDVIAWLEKYGEQPKGKEQVDNQNCVKPADNVEPKFHEGDWIVSEVTGSVYQIKYCVENLNTHKYGYDLTNGGYIGSYDVNDYHLWTIEDAEDGDVLVDVYGNIGMFNNYGFYSWMSYCSLGTNGCFRNFKVPHENDKTHPAIIEQYDLLFQKMKDAGYEFDFDKKELKKIEKHGN